MSHIGVGHRSGYLRVKSPRHNNVLHKRWTYLRARPRQRSSGQKDASHLPF